MREKNILKNSIDDFYIIQQKKIQVYDEFMHIYIYQCHLFMRADLICVKNQMPTKINITKSFQQNVNILIFTCVLCFSKILFASRVCIMNIVYKIIKCLNRFQSFTT